MKLNREQKRLLNLSGILLLIIVIFVVLIYNPKRVALLKLRAYVDSANAELSEINKMLGPDKTIKEEEIIMKEKAAVLSMKCVGQKDAAFALKNISDIANKTGVRIASTRPQIANVFTSKAGGQVKYENSTCMKMPVQLAVEGRFENLAKFIYTLENSLKGIYTIEMLSMRKQEDIFPELKMDLTTGVYLFSER